MLALLLVLAGGAAAAQEPGDELEGAIDCVAEVPPDEGPTYPFMSFGLRAELEYVDVEGDGGFTREDPATTGPLSRAARVELDKATVDFRLHLREWLTARAELRMQPDSARIDRVYLQADALDDALDLFDLEIEVGRNRPMTRGPDRRVETYSPLGRVFWRGREWHAGMDLEVDLEPLVVRAVASLAVTRPLGGQPMGEDPFLRSIAYDHAEIGEDSTPEGAVLIGGEAYGARLEGFAHFGQLLDDRETGSDLLRTTFDDNYILLSCGVGVPTCPAILDRTSRWYGARVAFDRWGFFFLAELIQNRLGNVDRRGFEVGGSYTLGFDVAGERVEIEPFLRYGELVTTNLPEVYSLPESWDRKQWVIALILRPLREVAVSIEYLILRERAGTSSEGDTEVKDDQLLIQLAFDAEVTP